MSFRFHFPSVVVLLGTLAVVAASIALVHAADGAGQPDSLGKLPNPSATNQRRVALVIGNADYQHADNLPKLTNPTNDAEDIAATLRGFGLKSSSARTRRWKA